MSDYYAFSSIDTAIDKTKTLLWPFKWNIWWRVALISLFIGGSSSFNPFQFTTGSHDIPFSTSGTEAFLNDFPLIIGIIAALIIIALIFAYLSSVFQFLFVECLSDKNFTIRKHFKKNLGRGTRLFGFELIIGALFSVIMIALILTMFAGMANFSTTPNFTFIVGLILAAFLLSIPFGIILLFTVDFVVPIMLKDNCGVIIGWRRCWAVMKKNWWQTIVYLVMKIILAVVTAIIMFIAILISALILAIPFFILGLITIGLSGGPATVTLFIIMLVIYIICLIPVSLIISVPFVTFLKHYTLDVLGNLENNYMMLR